MKEILEEIVSICKLDLGIDIQDVNASLVMQGASSMKLMQFVACIFEKYNLIIEIDEIFESNILHIATLIAERSALAESEMDNNPNETKNNFHCGITELQLPFWNMRHHAEGMKAYNEAITYHLHGEFDLSRCQAVALRIFEEQTALRTRFLELEGNVYQEEVTFEELKGKLKIEFSDLRHHNEPLKVCDSEFTEFFNYKFDLSSPPIFRIKVWQLADAEFVITCVIYHLVADLWSVDVIRKRALELYRHPHPNNRFEEIPKNKLSPQYELGTSYTSDDEKYWHHLFSLPLCDVNISREIRPAIKRYDGDMLITPLTDVDYHLLNSIRESYGVTMASMCFSAFYLLLSALSNNTDIVIGTPYLVRRHPANSDVVGMFVNTLPIRVNINRKDSFRDFVVSLHNELLKAYEHGSYPVQNLLNTLSIPTKLNRNPLFEELFTYYEKSPKSECPQTRIIGEEIELRRGKTKFDLSFFITSSEKKLSCKAEYSTVLFSQSDIQSYVDCYAYILDSVSKTEYDSIGKVIDMTKEFFHSITHADIKTYA